MPAGESSQVLATEIERVGSKIPTLFEREDTFFSQVEKRPVEIISERDMRIPLELRPGGKPGHWNSQGGDLGRGDMPTYDKAVINTVELIYRIEWTTRRKWATDSSRKAVINTFRRDLASSMKEFRRYVDCLCMTPGTGVLGTITSVSSAAGIDTYTCTTDGFGVRLLRFGQDYRIFNSTLGTDRNAADTGLDSTVTYIDFPNKTFKGTAVAGAVAGDLVVAQGLSATPPVSIFGVPYHHSSASTGSWLGFPRATTPEIRANRVNANGATLTLPAPRLALNKISDRLGLETLNKRLVAWCHRCQRQAYEELGFEAIQINKSASQEGLDLYFNDNMRIAGAPLKNSASWDKKRIDFVDMDAWGRAEFYPAQWYKDENGNKFFVVRGTSGGVASSNLAYIVASFNLYVNNPGAVSYIDNLMPPSGY